MRSCVVNRKYLCLKFFLPNLFRPCALLIITLKNKSKIRASQKKKEAKLEKGRAIVTTMLLHQCCASTTNRDWLSYHYYMNIPSLPSYRQQLKKMRLRFIHTAYLNTLTDKDSAKNSYPSFKTTGVSRFLCVGLDVADIISRNCK